MTMATLKNNGRFIKVFSLMVGIMAGVFLFSEGMLQAAAKPVALSGKINVNTAGVEELTQLPGIGVSKAEAIAAYRQAQPFRSAEELMEVKGIGPKMFEKLKDYIKVEGESDLQVLSAPDASPSQAVQS